MGRCGLCGYYTSTRPDVLRCDYCKMVNGSSRCIFCQCLLAGHNWRGFGMRVCDRCFESEKRRIEMCKSNPSKSSK